MNELTYEACAVHRANKVTIKFQRYHICIGQITISSAVQSPVMPWGLVKIQQEGLYGNRMNATNNIELLRLLQCGRQKESTPGNKDELLHQPELPKLPEATRCECYC